MHITRMDADRWVRVCMVILLSSFLLLVDGASSNTWSDRSGSLTSETSSITTHTGTTLKQQWTINITDIQTITGEQQRIRAIALRFILAPSFFSSSTYQSISIHNGESEISTRLAILHSEDAQLRAAYFSPDPLEATRLTQQFTNLTVLTSLVTIVYSNEDPTQQRHFDLDYDSWTTCPEGYQDAPEVYECIQIPPPYEYSASIFNASIVFNALVLLVELGMVGLVFRYRMSYLFRSASPIFSTLMLLGLISMGIGGITMSLSPNKGSVVCHARVWSIALGLSMTLSSLIVRADRIRRIFVENQLKKTLLTNKSLLKMVAACCAAQFIMLTVFSAAELSSAESHIVGTITTNSLATSTSSSEFSPSSYTLTTCTITTGALGWFGVECLILLSLLTAASWNAWQTRNVPSNFSESFWIGASVYMVGFFTLLLVPLVSLVTTDANPDASVIVSGFGLGLMSITLFSLLFASKVYYLLSQQHEVDLLNDTTVVVDATTGEVAVVASAALADHAKSPEPSRRSNGNQSGHVRGGSIDSRVLSHSRKSYPGLDGGGGGASTSPLAAQANSRRVSVVHGTLQQLVKASGPAAAAIGRARRATMVAAQAHAASPRDHQNASQYKDGPSVAASRVGSRGGSRNYGTDRSMDGADERPMRGRDLRSFAPSAKEQGRIPPGAIGTAIGSAYRPTERDILNPNLMITTEPFDPVQDEFSSRASHSEAAGGDHLGGLNHRQHSLLGEGSLLLESRRMSVRFDMASPSPLPEAFGTTFYHQSGRGGRRATNSPTNNTGHTYSGAFGRLGVGGGQENSSFGGHGGSSKRKRSSSPLPCESPLTSPVGGRGGDRGAHQYPAAERTPSSPSVARGTPFDRLGMPFFAAQAPPGSARDATPPAQAERESPVHFIGGAPAVNGRGGSPVHLHNSNLVQPLSIRPDTHSRPESPASLVGPSAIHPSGITSPITPAESHQHLQQQQQRHMSFDSPASPIPLEPEPGDTLSRMAVRARLNHDRRTARHGRGGSATPSQNLSTVGQENDDEVLGSGLGTGSARGGGDHPTPLSSETASAASPGRDRDHAADSDDASSSPAQAMVLPGCIADGGLSEQMMHPHHRRNVSEEGHGPNSSVNDSISRADRDDLHAHVSTPTNLNPASPAGRAPLFSHGTSLHYRTQSDSSAMSGPMSNFGLVGSKPTVNPLSNTVSPLGSLPHTPPHGPTKARPSLFIARPPSPNSIR